MASSSGNLFIHTAGTAKTGNFFKLVFATSQDAFVESMAEAATSKPGWSSVGVSRPWHHLHVCRREIFQELINKSQD